MEHIRGQFWHRYPVTVNQVMVTTVKRSRNDNINLTTRKLGSVASLLTYIYIVKSDKSLPIHAYIRKHVSYIYMSDV